MHYWQKILVTHKTISWFLIAVVLAIVLLPTHTHLQHVDTIPATVHEHAFDYHVVYEQHEHDHSEVAVLDASSHFLAKQLDDNMQTFMLLFVCLLLTTFLRTAVRYRQENNRLIRSFRYLLTPPLRAPPQ